MIRKRRFVLNKEFSIILILIWKKLMELFIFVMKIV